MTLLLARIDDRLIHGQVVVGCCGSLRAKRLLLCDDTVAADDLQRRIYQAAVPPEIEAEILDRAATVQRLKDLADRGEDESTVLVVATPADMLWLAESGADLREVNVGGLHARTDRREELWPGFFLGDEDRRALRRLAKRGVRLTVQSVPGSACVDASGALNVQGSGPTP